MITPFFRQYSKLNLILILMANMKKSLQIALQNMKK